MAQRQRITEETDVDRPLAKVLHLRPRTCFDCRYFEEIEPEDDWGLISYCPIFDEVIDSETYSAASCPAYEVTS